MAGCLLTRIHYLSLGCCLQHFMRSPHPEFSLSSVSQPYSQECFCRLISQVGAQEEKLLSFLSNLNTCASEEGVISKP